MLRTTAVAVLSLATLTLAGNARQDKDKDNKAKWTPSVKLTDKAGKWPLEEAKVGTKLLSDRDYALSDLPDEVVGGTAVLRNSAEYGTWLPGFSLEAKKDATVYAIVRTKYLRKETFGKEQRAQFEKEGWKLVEGKAATTFPAGEGWEWVAYKKDVKAGPVNLQLANLSWGRRTAVLFVVK